MSSFRAGHLRLTSSHLKLERYRDLRLKTICAPSASHVNEERLVTIARVNFVKTKVNALTSAGGGRGRRKAALTARRNFTIIRVPRSLIRNMR